MTDNREEIREAKASEPEEEAKAAEAEAEAAEDKAEAGKVIFFQGPMPLLPAEFTRMIPFCASIEAVCDINAVWPSRSLWR